jgi:aryl-alcohol dehydrogenase-like predicted oxidoreductase
LSRLARSAPPGLQLISGLIQKGNSHRRRLEWRASDELSLKIAQTIAAHAAARSTTPIAFALAWVLRNQLISAALAGPRTQAQWDGYLEALSVELGPEDEKLVNELVPPGHASTPGFTDPVYPVEGRQLG